MFIKYYIVYIKQLMLVHIEIVYWWASRFDERTIIINFCMSWQQGGHNIFAFWRIVHFLLISLTLRGYIFIHVDEFLVNMGLKQISIYKQLKKWYVKIRNLDNIFFDICYIEVFFTHFHFKNWKIAKVWHKIYNSFWRWCIPTQKACRWLSKIVK